jgi:hypothetical protein
MAKAPEAQREQFKQQVEEWRLKKEAGQTDLQKCSEKYKNLTSALRLSGKASNGHETKQSIY